MDFIHWNADPVMVSFMGLTIHWYGVFFATAVLSGYKLVSWTFQHEGKNTESLDNLFVYAIIGIIVGARLVHCFFYDPSYYLANPIKILKIWEGGLASHGGAIGVIIAVFIYSKKEQLNLLWLLDKIAIASALFGFFVRSGNFINSEIVGIKTKVSWAVVFERLDNLPRHPAQLYEAVCYLAIFVVLMVLYNKTKIKEYYGALLGVLLCTVFSARFIIEFVKEKQAAYSTDIALSTGQVLSIPFFIVGVILIVAAMRQTNTKTI